MILYSLLVDWFSIPDEVKILFNYLSQVEGRDISVCVRVRPLLDHEKNSGFFDSVFADHPSVHTLDPKFDVKGSAKSVRTKYEADFVFGPEHDNDQASYNSRIKTWLETFHSRDAFLVSFSSVNWILVANN